MTLDEEVQMAGREFSLALARANVEIAPALHELKQRIWRLEDALLGQGAHRPLIEQIISYAAFLFRVRRDEIIGPCRRSDIVRARFAVIWVVKQLRPDFSYPQIGRSLGDRDHSTIMAGEFRASQFRDSDEDFRALTDKLMAAFAERDDGQEDQSCLAL